MSKQVSAAERVSGAINVEQVKQLTVSGASDSVSAAEPASSAEQAKKKMV